MANDILNLAGVLFGLAAGVALADESGPACVEKSADFSSMALHNTCNQTAVGFQRAPGLQWTWTRVEIGPKGTIPYSFNTPVVICPRQTSTLKLFFNPASEACYAR